MITEDWPFTFAPPIPENEEKRLEALAAYESLEEEPKRDPAFDRLAKLAAEICEMPIALINLVGEKKEFKKACFGIEGETTPRCITFCQFAIMQDGLYEVHDATNHRIFYDNPNVTGALNLRYYAGMPLKTPDGYNIGTLCLVDQKPNALNKSQKQALKVLADEVISRFELNAARAKLEALNKEKDELIRIVSHDMRNPLSGIIGASGYLISETEDEEQKQILKLIEDSGEALLGIVNVLLNSEYIKNESFQVSKKKWDVAALTRDVINLYQPFAMLKKVTLHVDLPETCICMIDGEKWKQIVGNLLGNAIKFTPQDGSVTISVSQTTVNKKTQVILKISDTGVGIHEQHLSKLFSGSKEILKKGTEGEESTGLGMVLIHKYVTIQLGTITVVSQPNEGTTFKINIPV